MSGCLSIYLFNYRVWRSECLFVVDHAEKLHELPDEYLADMLPIAKKIAVAQGVENYNVLQVGTAFFSLSTPPSESGLTYAS